MRCAHCALIQICSVCLVSRIRLVVGVGLDREILVTPSVRHGRSLHRRHLNGLPSPPRWLAWWHTQTVHCLPNGSDYSRTVCVDVQMPRLSPYWMDSAESRGCAWALQRCAVSEPRDAWQPQFFAFGLRSTVYGLRFAVAKPIMSAIDHPMELLWSYDL